MDSSLNMFKEAFQNQSVDEAEKWQQAIEEKDRAAEECENELRRVSRFLLSMKHKRKNCGKLDTGLNGKSWSFIMRLNASRA